MKTFLSGFTVVSCIVVADLAAQTYLNCNRCVLTSSLCTVACTPASGTCNSINYYAMSIVGFPVEVCKPTHHQGKCRYGNIGACGTTSYYFDCPNAGFYCSSTVTTQLCTGTFDNGVPCDE